MTDIGSDVLLPSIRSIFYITTALLKSDSVPALKTLWLSEFWTYKDGTRFIFSRGMKGVLSSFFTYLFDGFFL